MPHFPKIMEIKNVLIGAGVGLGALYVLKKLNLTQAAGSLIGSGVSEFVGEAVSGASEAIGEIAGDALSGITDWLDQSSADTAAQIINNQNISNQEKLEELTAWANSQRWTKAVTIRVAANGTASFLVDGQEFTGGFLNPAWVQLFDYMNANYKGDSWRFSQIGPQENFTSQIISRGPYSFTAQTSYEVGPLKCFLGIEPQGVDMDSYLRMLSYNDLIAWRDGWFHVFSNFSANTKMDIIQFLQNKFQQYVCPNDTAPSTPNQASGAALTAQDIDNLHAQQANLRLAREEAIAVQTATQDNASFQRAQARVTEIENAINAINDILIRGTW